jgi:hypothetical protein
MTSCRFANGVSTATDTASDMCAGRKMPRARVEEEGD